MRSAAAGLIAVFTLTACSPTAPPGVDKDRLDEAVSRAIGHSSTCLLIAKAGSGGTVYRYNTATVCARTLPACGPGGERTAGDLLAVVAKNGQAVASSCESSPDGARRVGWAAGRIVGSPYVYAAVMEGQGPKILPGLVMADRLAGAFADGGVK
jgi:hypothetical protein